MTEHRYADPTALRRAVTDRLRTLARGRRAQLADLQRQFAYDRLLSRLFVSEPDRWVLKGATARWPGWAAPPGTRSTSTSTAPAIHSEFAAFHVDLVAGIAMTGEPDEMRPLVPLDLPGIRAPDYRVYPVADTRRRQAVCPARDASAHDWTSATEYPLP